MKKTLCAFSVVMGVASASVLAPAVSQAAAPAHANFASVHDEAGDEEVVFGAKPKTSLDIRRVRYSQGKNGALRVVVNADDILGKRARFTEHFSVAIYRDNDDFQDFTVHHRADGGLRVLDFTAPSGKVDGYRIPGRFFVRPGQNKAVFVIPTRAIGKPKSVKVHAGSYLEDRSSNVKTLDFTDEGRSISLR